MRLKFLSAIACFLIICMAFSFSACLGSDDDTIYSSDASVYAFGIGSIYGEHYKFSIDQVGHRIFNRDSLPMYADTLLDSIVVDTFTVSGYVTSGDLDTVFTVNKAVDLTAAVNNPNGLTFKIHAADGLTSRIYRLTINVHQQNPDSLVWKEMTSSENFPTMPLSQGVKLLSMGDYLFLYALSDNEFVGYKANVSDPTQLTWEELTLAGMPEDALLNTLLPAFESLFVITAGGDVYQSVDGAQWQIVDELSGDVKALLTAFPDKLAAIKQVDGTNYFCTTDASLQWTLGEAVENGFPTENIYSTVHQTSNGVYKSVLVGMPQTANDKVVPWFSMDGIRWADMEPSATNYCPLTNNPSIIFYGGDYYLFDAGLYAFYQSKSGLKWDIMTDKMKFPYSLREAKGYSATIDKNNYIWLVGAGNNIISNQLWRGRLNRLGFEHQ